jgi:hypothetical protein
MMNSPGELGGSPFARQSVPERDDLREGERHH